MVRKINQIIKRDGFVINMEEIIPILKKKINLNI